jgi:hypothetical protein
MKNAASRQKPTEGRYNLCSAIGRLTRNIILADGRIVMIIQIKEKAAFIAGRITK